MGFPGGTSGKETPPNAGDWRDVGLIPGSGRSPGRGHGNPLQYSCLENSTDRGVWQTMVHKVAESQTRLKQLSMHAFHCTDVLPSVFPFTFWRSFWLFPIFDDYEYRCYKDSCTCLLWTLFYYIFPWVALLDHMASVCCQKNSFQYLINQLTDTEKH